MRLNLIPLIAESLRQVVEEIRDFVPDLSLPDVISDRVAEAKRRDATQPVPSDVAAHTSETGERT